MMYKKSPDYSILPLLYAFFSIFILFQSVLTFELNIFLLLVFLAFIIIFFNKSRGPGSSVFIFFSLILLLMMTLFYLFNQLELITVKNMFNRGIITGLLIYSIIINRKLAMFNNSRDRENHTLIERVMELEESNRKLNNEIDVNSSHYIEGLETLSRIQNSILPAEVQLESCFRDFFTIWSPLKTVGGDFYWHHRDSEGFIIAVIDCSGKGIPGAVLSITVNNILQGIVNLINHDNPGVILTTLNTILKRTLSQENPYDNSDEGVEIGLCHYRFSDKTMTFSGAQIKLHSIDSKGNLLTYPGDRQGIGYKRSNTDYNYTNYSISTDSKLSFFMATKGLFSVIDEGRYLDLICDPEADMSQRKRALLAEIDDKVKSEDITVVGFGIDPETIS